MEENRGPRDQTHSHGNERNQHGGWEGQQERVTDQVRVLERSLCCLKRGWDQDSAQDWEGQWQPHRESQERRDAWEEEQQD